MNTSAGSSNTGRRFAVAVAAPVIRFVEPGPTEAAQAIAKRLNVSARMVKRDLVNGYAQLRMILVGPEARKKGVPTLVPAAGERE